MWGEMLEEDFYDDSQPFYDHELALKEKEAREKKMKDLQSHHPHLDPKSRKLKRKVIYVYEKEDGKEPSRRINSQTRSH
jgi:hypothetical protein